MIKGNPIICCLHDQRWVINSFVKSSRPFHLQNIIASLIAVWFLGSSCSTRLSQSLPLLLLRLHRISFLLLLMVLSKLNFLLCSSQGGRRHRLGVKKKCQRKNKYDRKLTIAVVYPSKPKEICHSACGTVSHFHLLIFLPPPLPPSSSLAATSTNQAEVNVKSASFQFFSSSHFLHSSVVSMRIAAAAAKKII